MEAGEERMKRMVYGAALLALLGFGVVRASAQGRGPGGPGGGGGARGGGMPPMGGPPLGSRGNGPGGGMTPGGPPPAGGGKGPSAGTAPGGAPAGPPARWWDDKGFAGTVGVRVEQQRKLDSVFDANRPAILSSYKTLLAEQTNLQQVQASTQDTSKIFAAVDAVNQARAALQKANIQLQLQIRHELDAAQLAKLDALGSK